MRYQAGYPGNSQRAAIVLHRPRPSRAAMPSFAVGCNSPTPILQEAIHGSYPCYSHPHTIRVVHSRADADRTRTDVLERHFSRLERRACHGRRHVLRRRFWMGRRATAGLPRTMASSASRRDAKSRHGAPNFSYKRATQAPTFRLRYNPACSKSLSAAGKRNEAVVWGWPFASWQWKHIESASGWRARLDRAQLSLSAWRLLPQLLEI